jgi:hypothetical protein
MAALRRELREAEARRDAAEAVLAELEAQRARELVEEAAAMRRASFALPDVALLQDRAALLLLAGLLRIARAIEDRGR